MLGGWLLLIDDLGDDLGDDNGMIFDTFWGGFSDFAYGTRHLG